ncbi:MAG: hypothetical protein KDA60_22765, partial [Planctomycetales bacterium]|nr:hypothetical protein [Planctomycetales bacterium]
MSGATIRIGLFLMLLFVSGMGNGRRSQAETPAGDGKPAEFRGYTFFVPNDFRVERGAAGRSANIGMWKGRPGDDADPGLKLEVFSRAGKVPDGEASDETLTKLANQSLEGLRRGSQGFRVQMQDVQLNNVPAKLSVFSGARRKLKLHGVSLVFVDQENVVNLIAMAFGDEADNRIQRLQPYLLTIKAQPATPTSTGESKRAVAIGDKDVPIGDVVTIIVDGIDFDDHERVELQLWPDKLPRRRRTRGYGSKGLKIIAETDEDIQKIASRINFGKVTLDRESRSLFIVGREEDLPNGPNREEIASRAPSFFTERLEQLGGDGQGRKQNAIKDLTKAGPNNADRETRRKVALALKDAAFDRELNSVARSSAIQGLRVWGGKHCVPLLIELLADVDDPRVHEPALNMLIELRDERAILPVARYLGAAPFADKEAVAFLRLFGPTVEEAVLENFPQPESVSARIHVIRLLEEIGSEKTIKKLESLAGQPMYDHIEYYADQAITAI